MAKPYDPKDFYFRKAKKAGLRARSAFKIDEILQRHELLDRGQAVLDLGAAPGGFLQVLAEAVGEKGVAVGVDLEPVRNLGKAWVKTAVVDLLAPDALSRIQALHAGHFQLVTSDMAPKTIGIKVVDEARSLELVRMALSVAERTLARNGAFVAKVFMGGDFPVLKKELAARFAQVVVARPKATRDASYEVYVVGKGFKGELDQGPSTARGERPRTRKSGTPTPPPGRSGRRALILERAPTGRGAATPTLPPPSPPESPARPRPAPGARPTAEAKARAKLARRPRSRRSR